MPYNYTDQQVTQRASSGGKDPGRMHTIDRLAAQATQPPHEDDQAALGAIMSLSGIPGGSGLDQAGKPTEGFADADARNYGKLIYGRITGATPEYQQAHDGSSGFLHTLGNVARVAAPVAGALIPGVGLAGGALIGGLGNAGGNLLAGRGFQPLESLGAGAVGGLGNMALGNGLGSGSSSFGFGAAAPHIPAAPTTALAGAGAPAAATTGAGAGAGAAGGGGGLAGALGRFGSIGGALQKFGPLALGGLGMIGQAKAQGAARDAREAAAKYATDDWNSRAPLRAAAMSGLLQPLRPQVDLSAAFRDPNDPYRRQQ